MFFKLLTGKIERATKDSAAFDVFYAGEKPIAVGDAPVLLPTGIRTEFDPQLVAILKEKSGLGLKGLEIKAGVIDADYRKEWGVVARFPIQYTVPILDERGVPVTDGFVMCTRADYKPFIVKPGDQIAQFLLIEKPKIEMTFDSNLAQIIEYGKLREGGFGSTTKPKA